MICQSLASPGWNSLYSSIGKSVGVEECFILRLNACLVTLSLTKDSVVVGARRQVV